MLTTGLTHNEVFQDGDWKRPSGMELLCIPIGEPASPFTSTDEDVLYECRLRSWPDNRTYE